MSAIKVDGRRAYDRVRAGDTVVQVQRVLSFQDVPTILEQLWLPGDPFKGLTLKVLTEHQGPMYALFESEFGVRMVRSDERIKAVERMLLVDVIAKLARVGCTVDGRKVRFS